MPALGEGVAVGSGLGLTLGDGDGEGVGEGEASFPAITTGLVSDPGAATRPTKLTPIRSLYRLVNTLLGGVKIIPGTDGTMV